MNRLKKVELFLDKFVWSEQEYYYKNMVELRSELSKTMKQKNDAKTIVFAIKMFGYGARNVFDFEEYPKEINIPIDSRLTNIFEKYKWEYSDINKFYLDLSIKLNILPLHLDGIIWNMYNNLIK